jgi:hypothetical protein
MIQQRVSPQAAVARSDGIGTASCRNPRACSDAQEGVMAVSRRPRSARLSMAVKKRRFERGAGAPSDLLAAGEPPWVH